MKQYSSLGRFVSYKENGVLWIRYLRFKHVTCIVGKQFGLVRSSNDTTETQTNIMRLFIPNNFTKYVDILKNILYKTSHKNFSKMMQKASALFFVDDEELNNVFPCELSCNLQFHIHKTPSLWQVILAIRTVVVNISKTFGLIVFISLSKYYNHPLI